MYSTLNLVLPDEGQNIDIGNIVAPCLQADKKGNRHRHKNSLSIARSRIHTLTHTQFYLIKLSNVKVLNTKLNPTIPIQHTCSHCTSPSPANGNSSQRCCIKLEHVQCLSVSFHHSHTNRIAFCQTHMLRYMWFQIAIDLPCGWWDSNELPLVQAEANFLWIKLNFFAWCFNYV